MKIYTIGHLSPDLDTVAAAYVYAEYLKTANIYPEAQIIPLASEEPNLETKTIFGKFGAELPKIITDVEIANDDKIILVDHNEESQRHPLIKNEQIIEILDHHKINISFTSPIKIDVRPLASTCTIVHLLYKANELKPTKQVEQLILAAILSDTSGLKSPTTTGTDSTMAHAIAQAYNIDLDDLIFEIFKAKSDISGMSAMDLIKKDYKVFDFGGKQVFIGSVETVEPEKVITQKAQIVAGLNELKSELGASHAYLCVTDLLKVHTQVIYETEAEGKVLETAFTTVASDNLADIGPRISRKKEIAPEIEKSII
jgi:manganese-dependent inorganic pyrophosphatase